MYELVEHLIEFRICHVFLQNDPFAIYLYHAALRCPQIQKCCNP